MEPISRALVPLKFQAYLPMSLVDASVGGGFVAQMFNAGAIPQLRALLLMIAAALVLGIVGGLRYKNLELRG